jgi:hypothetical protein
MNNSLVSKEELQKRLDVLLEKKNKLVQKYGAKKWKTGDPKIIKETNYIARHITILNSRINHPDKWRLRNKGKDKKKIQLVVKFQQVEEAEDMTIQNPN